VDLILKRSIERRLQKYNLPDSIKKKGLLKCTEGHLLRQITKEEIDQLDEVSCARCARYREKA
jgi:hypothetical protein